MAWGLEVRPHKELAQEAGRELADRPWLRQPADPKS
jgi:hypothetical protein